MMTDAVKVRMIHLFQCIRPISDIYKDKDLYKDIQVAIFQHFLMSRNLFTCEKHMSKCVIFLFVYNLFNNVVILCFFLLLVTG